MMPTADESAPPQPEEGRRLAAEQVRAALIECALATYEDARQRGLCAEGAWEAAIGAMRQLELKPLNSDT